MKSIYDLLIENYEGNILLTKETPCQSEIYSVSVVIDGWEAMLISIKKEHFETPDFIRLDSNLPKGYKFSLKSNHPPNPTHLNHYANHFFKKCYF